MKGTLKYNIDPLFLKTEQEIWEVMTMIGIDYLPKANKNGIEMMVLINIMLILYLLIILD